MAWGDVDAIAVGRRPGRLHRPAHRRGHGARAGGGARPGAASGVLAGRAGGGDRRRRRAAADRREPRASCSPRSTRARASCGAVRGARRRRCRAACAKGGSHRLPPAMARYDSRTSWRRRACGRAGRTPGSRGARGCISAGWRWTRRPAPPEAVLPDYLRDPDAKPTVNEPLEIRRLTYADLPQVIAIERRAFPRRGRSRCSCSSCRSHRASASRRARGRLVGYLICSRYDTVWHLMNVAVDARLRREGIATALIEHLFAAADRPASSTRSRCAPRTRPRSRLYERFGFRAAGLRRGYYHDNKEDAVIMWRTGRCRNGARRTRRRAPSGVILASRPAATTPARRW